MQELNAGSTESSAGSSLDRSLAAARANLVSDSSLSSRSEEENLEMAQQVAPKPRKTHQKAAKLYQKQVVERFVGFQGRNLRHSLHNHIEYTLLKILSGYYKMA